MLRPVRRSRWTGKIACLLAAVLSSGVSGRSIAQTSVPVEVRPAPDFSRNDLDRRPVKLAAFRGKVVLLDFWATWCAPCLEEMPRLVELQGKYKATGLQIIGISMDDDEPPVRAAYRKFRLNYPVAMGDGQLGELYGGIFGLPVIFLIDRDGRIRFRHRGAVDFATLESETQSLLSEH